MARPGLALGGVGGLGVIILFLILAFTGGGGNLDQMLNQLNQVQQAPQSGVQPEEFQGEDEYEVFASLVLGANDEYWARVFDVSGLSYVPPTLVLFRGSTNSACGGATSAAGPHYCPLDQTIYLDETFFDEVLTRLGASGGDVAEAYVISHEVGHHVQNLIGLMDEVRAAQQAASNQAEVNDLSVRMELQADCFAGLWANSIADAGVFLPGEIDEAIDAAEAVGDDRIQQQVEGQLSPERWTHGSSEQRVEWFNLGFDTGDPSRCDTFS